ncbi:hypothetical protein ACFW42_26355 [Streptomyces albidoflavus]
MHDLAKFLTARIADDHHAYAYVAHTFGGEALLDSHLPLLDLTEQLANDHRTMALPDSGTAPVCVAPHPSAQPALPHPFSKWSRRCPGVGGCLPV